jgi:predicted  nucleic acid-binding Zn-ribbon protein
MRANAILGLLSDLYSELTAAQDRIAELEQEVSELRARGAGPSPETDSDERQRDEARKSD